MKVLCELQHVSLTNDRGHQIDSVRVSCGRCGYETESFGRGENSILRCLAMMRDECPEEEENFYEIDEGDEGHQGAGAGAI